MLRYLSVLLFFLLVSCTRIVYVPLSKPPLGIEPRNSLELEDVSFFVSSNGICLSPENFKEHLLNERKILSFVLEQNKIIQSYINYYENPEND